MRQLRRFLALNPVEKRVLLRALVVLAWVRYTVPTRGLGAVEARIARVIAANRGRRYVGTVGCGEHEVTRLLLAAQRTLPWRNTCLHLAAALRLLLAERGIGSELRFGVRNQRGTFTAHAWLECAGRVLVGGTDVYERYAAFRLAKRSERA
jgi:hypothetical protein